MFHRIAMEMIFSSTFRFVRERQTEENEMVPWGRKHFDPLRVNYELVIMLREVVSR